MKPRRANVANRLRIACITGLTCTGLASGLVGCQSTRPWSPVSWFSNRQPDADKIASKTDSSQLPTSPALNHSPTSLASNNASGGNAAAPSGGTSSGLPYGTVAANNSSAAPSGGYAAAQANGFTNTGAPPAGYQTGPYGMSTAPNASTTLASSSIPAATTVASSGPSPTGGSADSGFPSPYGGTYSPSSSGYGTQSTASGYDVSQAGYGSSSSGYSPNLATSTPSTYESATPTSGLPEYPSLPGYSATPGSGSPGSTPATTVSGVANVPLPAFDSNYGAPAASAYQPAPQSPPAGDFAPGTTGRTTNYNFGTVGTGGTGSY